MLVVCTSSGYDFASGLSDGIEFRSACTHQKKAETTRSHDSSMCVQSEKSVFFFPGHVLSICMYSSELQMTAPHCAYFNIKIKTEMKGGRNLGQS